MHDIHFWMEGAGVRSVNGVYIVVGFHNGALLFRHEDEEEGVVHYLSCTTPRKSVMGVSTWTIVSSENFPDPEKDILFYTCNSTFLKGALPSSSAWRPCSRQSPGLAELLLPVPQVFGLMRTRGCIDVLASSMIDAEIWEDQRVSVLVESLAAKREEQNGCFEWATKGTCSQRFRTCLKSHAARLRLTAPQTKCTLFLSDKGCVKSSYECDNFHSWSAKKMRTRAQLLRMVPTLLVEDKNKHDGDREPLLF